MSKGPSGESSFLDDVAKFAGDNFGTLAGLLGGGGAGALYGGYISSKEKEGETAEERQKRRMKNILVGALGGALAGGGIGFGIENLVKNTSDRVDGGGVNIAGVHMLGPASRSLGVLGLFGGTAKGIYSLNPVGFFRKKRLGINATKFIKDVASGGLAGATLGGIVDNLGFLKNQF